METNAGAATRTMRAVTLPVVGGPEVLTLEQVEIPAPGPGEALVRVHAAGITRDELEWPTERLPAIPSYELSGVVAAVGQGVSEIATGDAVYALTPFDRDGVAADYATVPADLLAPKPAPFDHVESAALPLAGLSAWQGLFDHGHLSEGERVLVTGATGGVGHLATQIARSRGAHVIGTTSRASRERASDFGANELVDHSGPSFDSLEPVDLVFDTAGGEVLERSQALVRDGGTLVSVAEEPPKTAGGVYFVVEPNRAQLVELTRLAEQGKLRPAVDSVFPLTDARAAFERSLAGGKRGKVVLRVADE